MTFVSALFLLGIAGVVGPIVVHLFARPRYKRLPFTMLQFLREGQSESQARRRLRDWIILLLRCMIIAGLAVLFARPLWETQSPPPPSEEVWFVGLDNSLSLTWRSGGSDLLADLRAQAKALLRNCNEDAEFHVFLASGNQWHRHVTKAKAMALVHEMAPANAPAQFGEFLRAVQQCSERLDETARLNVVLGSDFASDVIMGLRGLMTPAQVDELNVLSVLPDPDRTNVGIVSASVTAVDQEEIQMHVTVRNTGAHPVTRLLQDRAGSCKPREITLLPKTHEVCALACPAPRSLGSLERDITLSLNGSDDFEADDAMRLTVNLPSQTTRHVLLIDSAQTDRLFLFDTAIESLADLPLGQTWQTRPVHVDRMTSTDLAWADVVVLAGMTDALSPWIDPLKRMVGQGKRLVCFMTDRPNPAVLSAIETAGLWPVLEIQAQGEPVQPESQPAGSAWTHAQAGESLMQYELDRMALRQTSHARLAPEAQCVWRLQNGSPFVAVRPLGQGVTLWVNTSIDASLSRLAKSSAAVAWAQFLLDSGKGSHPGESHEPWRDCEPILRPVSQESIDKVTRALFQEDRSNRVESTATMSVTKQWPLWRSVAWCLLILLLLEPFVAERMKP